MYDERDEYNFRLKQHHEDLRYKSSLLTFALTITWALVLCLGYLIWKYL